jgi:hypothetical protein
MLTRVCGTSFQGLIQEETKSWMDEEPLVINKLPFFASHPVSSSAEQASLMQGFPALPVYLLVKWFCICLCGCQACCAFLMMMMIAAAAWL